MHVITKNNELDLNICAFVMTHLCYLGRRVDGSRHSECRDTGLYGMTTRLRDFGLARGAWSLEVTERLCRLEKLTR